MTFERLGRLMVAAAPIALAAGCAHERAAGAPGADAPTAIGRTEISTIPFDPQRVVRTATYTPSGKVLVSWAEAGDKDERALRLATMNDDGTGLRTFYTGRIPDRPKDNGLRFMVFPDDKRIFLGDFILECAAVLERCENPQLLPVRYPAEVADGAHIGHRWSEMIVAPDNRHVAWTTLLANYSALVFVGELQKDATGYTIADPRIVSTLNPFDPDPAHPGGVQPRPVNGGEVKQFVAGGTALSVVGAVRRDLPDSVVWHLATGTREAITDTPGYTETTIFSPDERLGIVMTTRFSAQTDPAVLGLVPRPYPDSLNMGLSMFAYTYAVTGVRRERPGNVGPALIDIAASKREEGYSGINLNTDPDWVYYSPMSWHPGGRKAMWLEGRRDGGSQRIQIVTLPDYRPGTPVAARPTPTDIPGAVTDLAAVQNFARASRDIDVTVHGRRSGTITYKRTPTRIEKVYTNFSDDGASVYTGSETLDVNPRGNSTYVARLQLTGPRPGRMDLTVTFGPLGGPRPAPIRFESGPDGQPLSHGFAEYDGRRVDVAGMVP